MSIRLYAQAVARRLADRRLRVVFAESCTAGLVSASLARIPGISQWHCGAAVTYREQTKVDWLGVSQTDLQRCTAVSEPVARQMAIGVLRKTPEAHVSASVTGHLGPDAPPTLDGVIFVGIARRRGSAPECVNVWRLQLQQRARLRRQVEAGALVLQRLAEVLD